MMDRLRSFWGAALGMGLLILIGAMTYPRVEDRLPGSEKKLKEAMQVSDAMVVGKVRRLGRMRFGHLGLTEYPEAEVEVVKVLRGAAQAGGTLRVSIPVVTWRGEGEEEKVPVEGRSYVFCMETVAGGAGLSVVKMMTATGPVMREVERAVAVATEKSGR